jgi:hypothetical protein
VHFPIILLNKKLCVQIPNFIFARYFFIKITYWGKYFSGNSPPNIPWACQIVDNLACTEDITNDNVMFSKAYIRLRFLRLPRDHSLAIYMH